MTSLRNTATERKVSIGPLMLLWQYGRTDGRRWWNIGLVWR